MSPAASKTGAEAAVTSAACGRGARGLEGCSTQVASARYTSGLNGAKRCTSMVGSAVGVGRPRTTFRAVGVVATSADTGDRRVRLECRLDAWFGNGVAETPNRARRTAANARRSIASTHVDLGQHAKI